jgi:hypothetical protein
VRAPARARLAQLVERFTCNEEVAGSSPAAGLALQRGFRGLAGGTEECGATSGATGPVAGHRPAPLTSSVGTPRAYRRHPDPEWVAPPGRSPHRNATESRSRPAERVRLAGGQRETVPLRAEGTRGSRDTTSSDSTKADVSGAPPGDSRGTTGALPRLPRRSSRVLTLCTDPAGSATDRRRRGGARRSHERSESS